MKYLSSEELMIVKLSISDSAWRHLEDTLRPEFHSGSDFIDFKPLGYICHALVDYNGKPMASGIETSLGKVATLSTFEWRRGAVEDHTHVLCLSSDLFFDNACMRFSSARLMQEFLDQQDRLEGYQPEWR